MRPFTDRDLEVSNYFARNNRVRLGDWPYEGATREAPCTLKTLEDIRNLQSFAFWVTDGYVFENQFKNAWCLVSADCYSFLDPTPAFGEDGRKVVDLEAVFRVVVPGVDGRLHEQSISVLANFMFSRDMIFTRRYPMDSPIGKLMRSGVGETINRLRQGLSAEILQNIRLLNTRQALLIGCDYVSARDKPFMKDCGKAR